MTTGPDSITSMQNSASPTMPKIVVVPHSAIVVRRPEKTNLQPPVLSTRSLRARFGKRGVLLPSSPTSENATSTSLFRSSMLRRLLRRGSTAATGTGPHADRIFDLHANNQRQELRRRNTEESLRRKAKSTISRPFVSPPAPDRDVLKKYGERQDDWKRRSIALNTKKAKDPSVKRWSLRTWKVNSGRDHASNSRRPNQTQARKPLPSSFAKRVLSFSSQRWSFRPVPETLNVKRDRKNYVRVPTPAPKHNRSASDTRAAQYQRHLAPPQVPKKASSVGSIRSQVHHDHHLAIPTRQPNRRQIDRRNVRPQISFDDNLAMRPRQPRLDQRAPHPAPRQQLSFDDRFATCLPRLDQSGARFHPALRQQTSLDENLTNPNRQLIQPSLDQRHIHPAFRRDPPNLTNPPPTFPAPPLQPLQQPKPPVPRVRVIPPSTFIQPHNFTTKHTILPIKPPTLQEQTTLIRSLNSMRASASCTPLDLHPLLSNHAQGHAALYLAPLPPPKPLPPGHTARRSSARKQPKPRATTVEEIAFKSPITASAIRLISPPGLGALACGELWAGGKYKRHKTVRHGQVPSQHRFTLLPGFELGERDSVVTNGSWNGGASWCGCAEWDAWRAVTDGRWRCCGVGRAEDGRWVVDLWEPEGGRWVV